VDFAEKCLKMLKNCSKKTNKSINNPVFTHLFTFKRRKKSPEYLIRAFSSGI